MTILYFAWLRSRLGRAVETAEPPEGVTTVADLVVWLASLSPRHAEVLGDRRVLRVAVNQEFARFDHPVRPGDEIALFPPVTGG